MQAILPMFVTDRYKAYISACKVLAFCRSHVRRDFITIQIKYPNNSDLVKWAQNYIELISEMYCFNKLRVSYPQNSKMFNLYQNELNNIRNKMKIINSSEYTNKIKTKQAKSMRKHWKDLTLFMEFSEIPLDNNLAER